MQRGWKVCSFRLSLAVFSALNRMGSSHAINFTVPIKELLNLARAAEINIILNYIYLKKSLSNRPAYFDLKLGHLQALNPLTPKDPYSGRTAPLTSKRCILYIYSTNTGTEYFKHGIYCPFSPLQNAVCFIILTYLVHVLCTFYIQCVLKFKKNNSGAKRLIFTSTFRRAVYNFV